MADDQAQVLLCGLLRWKAFKYTTPVGTNSKVRAEPLKFSDTLVWSNWSHHTEKNDLS